MPQSESLLQAVQMATRTLSGTGHIDDLLPKVLQICITAVGASGGTIYLHDEATQTLIFRHVLPDTVKDLLQFSNIPDDFGVAGKVLQTRQSIISEFEPTELSDRNTIETQTGIQVRTMISVPLMLGGEAPIGVVQLINKQEGTFTAEDSVVLDTVAAVSTLAFLNHKLAEEMTKASTLLGMGKVSHDIGNLASSLHANINVAEYALEMLDDGEPTEREARAIETINETVTDLRQSVDRIVSYSRLISDLSAGRTLRPEKSIGSLAETIETAASYLATQARMAQIELEYDIQRDAPPFNHDPQFVFRIVQNLVGNAIKAVQESNPKNNGDSSGSVTVSYCAVESGHILEVTDSGPGMTSDVAARILSGNARSMWAKAGGSGWGTKIVLELAATHDGRVEIDSEPGKGSTFRITFPVN